MLVIAADCANSGEADLHTLSSHKIQLVTTNFIGRKSDEIYADFKFSADSHFLMECINVCILEKCRYDARNDRFVAYLK